MSLQNLFGSFAAFKLPLTSPFLSYFLFFNFCFWMYLRLNTSPFLSSHLLNFFFIYLSFYKKNYDCIIQIVAEKGETQGEKVRSLDFKRNEICC